MKLLSNASVVLFVWAFRMWRPGVRRLLRHQIILCGSCIFFVAIWGVAVWDLAWHLGCRWGGVRSESSRNAVDGIENVFQLGPIVLTCVARWVVLRKMLQDAYTMIYTMHGALHGEYEQRTKDARARERVPCIHRTLVPKGIVCVGCMEHNDAIVDRD